MGNIQEYYHSSVGHCMIWGDVVDKPEMVVVSENNDYGDLRVVRRKDLVKKEDTWEFKQAEKRANELRLITAKAEEQFNKLVEKVIKAATSTLTTRMKMNVLFSKGMQGSGWVLPVIDELNKLVREKAPEAIKDEKNDF